MKKQEELVRELTELVKETKEGKVKWKVECQTTEYHKDEEKPVVEEDGIQWTVDECYVSYYCEYKDKEFLMTTYEMMHQAGNKMKTTNLIFLPPLGVRYFDLHTLMPYAVDTSQMLIYQVHMLWLTILDLYQKNPEQIVLDVSERTLTIEP